ncbi:ABC transporter ATP-binding protein/permease [Nostoc edaphicum CCNP1411]|uniref:ABC transporter ATP-binding protein/permease n=1 Tax=Nostoc edaphicum CCNP1411 TaxID=1472755 RepID=A0A7D7QRT4_9NOSO|nr:ABC transporter ATP-binding protein/permease [Nostoc edaphicum]QMS92205.1 ABC transporter ATP-binding protein/permease [Nostoc edaphicum CCNP1411]
MLHQFWRVGKLYWLSQQRWKAVALLLLLLFLSLLGTGLLIAVSIFLGEMESSLAAADKNRFSQAVSIFLGVLFIGVPIISLKVYIQGKLNLFWRQWLTDSFLNKYFSQQNFYRLTAYSEIDNPDQRIAEDIQNFTQQCLYFAIVISDSILQLIGFSGLLWGISQPLMVFLIVYAIAGTVVTTIAFGRILVGINLEQLKREADFRYGLIRIRDNAEAIAFYQGETVESQELWQRFLGVFSNFTRLIRWQLGLDLFQNSYQYITFLLPTLVLAPQILSGELEIGVSAQAGVAFRSILIALGLIVSQFEQLSALAAAVTRLDELQTVIKLPHPNPPLAKGRELDFPVYSLAKGKELDSPISPLCKGGLRGVIPKEKDGEGCTVLNWVEDTCLSFQNVTLQTPDYQTVLVQDLSFTLAVGESLLISGKSGVGKTSLLRALAGLWEAGSGTITHPERSRLLFLPQRPYMVLGSLRQQLLYPNSDRVVAKDELLQVLKQVNLTNLVERTAVLDTVEDWGRVLSVGEQQRLAFARLLLQSPQYAILDEATSALDENNQTLLYGLLQKTDITYISVGHRSSLRSFHRRMLELQGDGKFILSLLGDA